MDYRRRMMRAAAPTRWEALHDVGERFRRLATMAQTPNDLKEPLHLMVQELGFHNFSFLTGSSVDAVCGTTKPLFLTSYPERWTFRYVERGYNRVDPVVEDGRFRRQAIFWGGTRYLRSLPGEPRQVMLEAREFGILSALSIPVHGPRGEFSLFTVSCDWERRRFNQYAESAEAAIILLAHKVNEILMGMLPAYPQPAMLHLTTEERECLRWILEGKTHWEIATIIGRAEGTVRYHLSKAITKCNSVNSTQAAFVALKAGAL